LLIEKSSAFVNGENLLRQADLCLYEAKRLGRNRVKSDLPENFSSWNYVASLYIALIEAVVGIIREVENKPNSAAAMAGPAGRIDVKRSCPSVF
jgi:hypothetical protein